VTGRAAQTTVTITGKVKEIGGTKAKGSCSFTGTRDERPVSGSCTIVFTGKEKDDGSGIRPFPLRWNVERPSGWLNAPTRRLGWARALRGR